MDGGTWWATVYGVAKSRTLTKQLTHTHTHTHTHTNTLRITYCFLFIQSHLAPFISWKLSSARETQRRMRQDLWPPGCYK